MLALASVRDNIVTLRLTPDLDRDDYEAVKHALKYMTEAHRHVRLLIELHDGVPWNPKSFWNHVKLPRDHASAFDRAAVVDTAAESQAAEPGRSDPFFRGPLRYFGRDEHDDALAWLEAG